MIRKMQMNVAAVTCKSLRLLLPLAIWSCHAWVAPTFRLYRGLAGERHPEEGILKPKLSNSDSGSQNKSGTAKKAEMKSHVMLNPESVMPNLLRHLFRTGLFQHPASILSAFSRRTFHPRSQDEVFRSSFNKTSPPRTHRPLNPSGFTLIELIVTMVIIGILAATVLPMINFGSISSQTSVAGAANMVASDIRYAQEWAMANYVSKSIVFTNGSSTYTFSPVSTGMDPSGQLPSGVTIGTTITFTFNSLGEPILNGGNSVSVSGTTIPVLQYTGMVNY
jgi:prepilin-type N-terminal cleavage/methylation domain-containing protein